MPWQIVILRSNIGSALNILSFYPLCFQCCKMALRVPLIWSTFANVTSFRTSSFFLSQPFYSCILITVSFNSIYFMIVISFSVISFHLFAVLLSFLFNSLFHLPDKEETQLYALLSVWELNNRCTVTSQGQNLEEVMGMATDLHVHLLFI